MLSSFAHASGEQDDLLLPARATSSFTTVAGQGWLVGLAEPALDAGTTLAYRRVGRQGGIGSSDRDGLFEQETDRGRPVQRLKARLKEVITMSQAHLLS